MADRKWITREEIAEIWDSIARREVMKRPDPISQVAPRFFRAKDAARTLRATEKLDNPLGSRT